MDIKNRPRIPIPDEDPYSVAGAGSSSSVSSGFVGTGTVSSTREYLLAQSQQHQQRRSEKPPKLPPRENIYPHDIPKVKPQSNLMFNQPKPNTFVFQPDYDDYDDEGRFKHFASSRNSKEKSKEKKYG